MKILLTGASSYVGARLFLDLSQKFEVVGTYFGNKLSDKFLPLDITDQKQVEEVINREKPEVIIHAAANANAVWCEEHPDLAIKLNQESTKYIVQAANKIGAKVILVSSFAAITATDLYGKTKQKSEEYVKETQAGYIILRPSLIIGFSPNTQNDRPFNRILKNIIEHTKAEYDTSWQFQPTYVGHISEVIEQVIEKNITNETIPITVPELKNRYELAKDILQAFDIEVTPIDKKAGIPVTRDNLSKLKELGLPQYSYDQMIEEIIEEIKHRDKYIL